MGDRDGGAAVEGGIIEGLSGFCFWLEGDCLFRGGGDFRVVVCARGNSWVLISMGSLSMRLRSFGAREDALVGRPVGGGSLWGFRVSSFGWEVAAAFFVAVGCFWLEGDCLFRGGGDFRVVVCARGNSWVLISMGSLSMRLRSFGAREDALVGRPVGGGSLWGFRVSSFGWEVAAAFFVAVGGSRLASVPRRFNCSQIAMRCLSVSLGSFRARETAMGKRPTREASLRGFWIFVFGWRVAVFSRQW